MKNVTVMAEPAGSGLVIRWADDGIGIAEEDKEKIFERGFGKKTGLGLFLARESGNSAQVQGLICIPFSFLSCIQ